MKILGVGLSRTGTLSLCEALGVLGFNAIHWEPERLRDVIFGDDPCPSFDRYDDVDAVTDLPASVFYDEIKEAYPDCRFILTTRDEDSWYESVRYHYDVRVPRDMKDKPLLLSEARATQSYVYGSVEPIEFLYKKRFKDHQKLVLSKYPETLVMDIVGGDGWDILCEYLNLPVPDIPFPLRNKSLPLPL